MSHAAKATSKSTWSGYALDPAPHHPALVTLYMSSRKHMHTGASCRKAQHQSREKRGHRTRVSLQSGASLSPPKRPAVAQTLLLGHPNTQAGSYCDLIANMEALFSGTFHGAADDSSHHSDQCSLPAYLRAPDVPIQVRRGRSRLWRRSKTRAMLGHWMTTALALAGDGRVHLARQWHWAAS